MNNLNSILLEGNLVKDPENYISEEGNYVCNFVIKSDRYYKHNDNIIKEFSIFDIVVFGKLAEKISYLKKGAEIRVIGRLKQEIFMENNGYNRSKVYVVADHVEYRSNLKDKE